MYKVTAVSGSPRPRGNTEQLLQHTLDQLAQKGAEVELIPLAHKEIRGCRACIGCAETGICVQKDDFAEVFTKIKQSDAIILGSPVYVGSITPEMKALIDRGCYSGRRDPQKPLKRKIGAPMVVARRAGHGAAISQINSFFLIMEMIIPGASYWPLAFGKEKGDVQKDEEGLQTAESLAANIWWLLQKLHS